MFSKVGSTGQFPGKAASLPTPVQRRMLEGDPGPMPAGGKRGGADAGR